ncbi:hypothetical protein CHU92_01740 [Flavobacterium cyanobacteriorum]|uniref:Uncharacterized protein n=1 Tax=Flavobacterium cyanobacteriorum TaxID=2022802 RepID=A0A255ZXA4_9FLAO|nr:carboxypeptidase-like regulatory domain-containing protein [Flavobacterium cyanobacteriorum]OYQ46009.1 hypothetical protein CHU92_01740 [Flavobacterium cyanobacteriorum]
MIKNLILFFLISNTINSQTTIKGKISDLDGNPIPNASVVINYRSSEDIIAFSITDEKGNYSITFSKSQDEIDIKVSSIDFETINETLKNESQRKDFRLNTKVFELKEVVVESQPITQDGDTIKYSVNTFAKEQDRSIADVLKRMPGIEVLSDGKILYQGKPINKYYIEGLDLLEGKYNLANENLPYKDVTQVQILENHQPIKMLDSLKFSDDAALNIKLRKSYTFTGQAKIGSGFSPLLWETNITPMLFTKKQQMLASYQSNNTGSNIALQLESLTIDDLFNQFESSNEKTNWLSIQQLSIPDFSEKRWLDNNIHLLTFNHLQKLRKNYELRLNISYVNDYQQQNGYTNTQFITPTNTINLLEEKNNLFFSDALQTNITLQKNADKNYFKNCLDFEGSWDRQRGLLYTVNENVTQNLTNHYLKISNSHKSIFAIGKQLFTLNSYAGFNKTPQTLKVDPGQFEAILNNNNLYEEVIQRVDLKTFYTNNSFSFIKGYNQLTLEPRVGFQIENQTLNSRIATSENTILSGEFSNNLDWMRSKIYFELQTQYQKNKWRLELTTPVNIQSYTINDNPLQEKESLHRTTFEPRLSVIYDLNTYWKINSSVSITNQFGTINQLYYAYILQNYRSIQRINAPLLQTLNQNKSLGVNFRDPLTALFCTFIYTNSKSDNNLLYVTQVLTNGSTIMKAIEQKNTRVNQSVSARINKYFNKLKTNAILNGSYSVTKFQQILNFNDTAIKNVNWSFGNKIDIDVFEWLNLEYQSNWTFSKNKIQEEFNSTIMQQNHSMNLNFNLNNNHFFAIKSEYINNNLFTERSENLFTDLIYRYTIKKKKIDLEFQINNLFNTTNFKTVSISDYSYIETGFNLRPRQAMFKITFAL